MLNTFNGQRVQTDFKQLQVVLVKHMWQKHPIYRVWPKKWTPKVFRRFLSNRLGFKYEILQLFLVKPSTYNCQVKYDFVEKRQRYRLFNMTAYWLFSIRKYFS